MTAIYIITGIILLIASFGFISMKINQKDRQLIHEYLLKLDIKDIKKLRSEFIQKMFDVHNIKFDDSPSLEELNLIEKKIRNFSILQTFPHKEFKYYYVLVIGAYLGSIVEKSVNGEWDKADDGEPFIKGHNEFSTFPFSKVLNYAIEGQEGDFYSYLQASSLIDKVIS